MLKIHKQVNICHVSNLLAHTSMPINHTNNGDLQKTDYIYLANLQTAIFESLHWLSNSCHLNSKERVVYSTVVSLARQNWIKTPEIAIYEDSEPNAFATGPSKNNSLVAVSTWLLNAMDENAIEWVVWHEMAHVLNWDMVTMTLLQWVYLKKES